MRTLRRKKKIFKFVELACELLKASKSTENILWWEKCLYASDRHISWARKKNQLLSCLKDLMNHSWPSKQNIWIQKVRSILNCIFEGFPIEILSRENSLVHIKKNKINFLFCSNFFNLSFSLNFIFLNTFFSITSRASQQHDLIAVSLLLFSSLLFSSLFLEERWMQWRLLLFIYCHRFYVMICTSSILKHTRGLNDTKKSDKTVTSLRYFERLN